MQIFYILTLSLLFLSALVNASDSKLIPLEHFSREENLADVSMSPNGEKIAFLAAEKNQTALFSYDFKSKNKVLLISTKQDKWRFDQIKWVSDNQLVVSALVIHQSGKTTHYNRQYYLTNFDGSSFEPMFKSNGMVGYFTGVVSWLPLDPDHILVHLDKSNVSGVYKLNINSDKKVNFEKNTERLVKDVGRNTYWCASPGGTYFVGVAYNGEKRSLYFRDLNESTTKKFHEYTVVNEQSLKGFPEHLFPLAFNADSSIVFFRGLYKNRLAIFKSDLSRDELIFELVASSDTYDLSGSIIVSPKTQLPVGVYFNGNTGESIYWDPAYKALQARIDKALKGGNIITEMSRDENRYIVLHSEPNTPPAYLLGDVSKKAISLIGEKFPELLKDDLPKRRSLKITVRDGLELQAFLTIPVGLSEKVLPAIVLPHGGPHAFDTESFDLMAAFLASRGFLVLQVNFRGSYGLGTDFLALGYKNWGLDIQQDITNATQWLIDKKMVDENRICILGFNFGGYTALMGAIQNSNLYRCAVSISGVTDLIDLVNFNVFASGYDEDIIGETLGRRWSDHKRLKLTSPIEYVEKLTLPLLLIHGEADNVVPYRQSKNLYDKVKKINKNVKLVTLQEEMHNIRFYENRMILFKEIEEFLLKNTN